jgi:photosystem II stability/assembly factor-like uncharacterized protein
MGRRGGAGAACLLVLALVAPSRGQEPGAIDARLLDVFTARCIGPANMGGRIVDVAVVESNPSTMYVAAATGGLWRTTDGGDSWTPLTDALTTSMGAVAVAPSDPRVVWLGSGEANARNSASWGDGVYRSGDAGKTWRHMGLRATQHIGRIVIHPTRPEVVYVAALGHLWGPNPERGLFKTSDGGTTWQHVLALDADTGCIDVTIDPAEPDVVYAAAYAVRRDAFSGGNPVQEVGPKAGLYKSTDGGRNWKRLTEGLPQGPYGRCGLAVYRQDPSIAYAVVQTAKTIATPKGQPANQELSLEAGGIFRSADKGETWTQVNSLVPRPFYYGQIRADPSDAQRVWVLGVQMALSTDGGKTFGTGGRGTHSDHHALWINPKDGKYLVLGNDGGLYFSRTGGKSWEAIRGMALGQFYGIAVDLRKPYRVYGGLQDNGSWGGPSATRSEAGITLADWRRVGGGDGFYCAVDPTDPDTVYCEMQYGGLRRVDLKNLGAKGGKGAKGGPGKMIKPGGAAKGKGTGSGYRFNWSAPLLLSQHDSKTLYYGGNFLFKSTNRGDTWDKLGDDLTRGRKGVASFRHTITTIAESPLKAGLLYVGTDDGRVQLTRDGGKMWTDLSDNLPGLPQERWVTRVECSHHAKGTAYVTIDLHRNDDRRPYVFRTPDYGATWEPLANNLPPEASVHVVRESSRNKDLLFAGTEQGLFVSLNGGRYWQRFGKGLPVVPVHDLVIHPRDRELVVGTHGRSLYVIDIAPLEELTPQVLARAAHLFAVRPATALVMAKAENTTTAKGFVAANPPAGAVLFYHLKSNVPEPVRLVVVDKAGKTVATLRGPQTAGLHRLLWNLMPDDNPAAPVAPAEYSVRLEIGGQALSGRVQVERTE